MPTASYLPARKAILDERRRKVVEMREQGFKFREIGDAVGTSTAYAQNLYADAIKRMELLDDVFGLLSVRARKCIEAEGWKTKDEVVSAIKTGLLHPKKQSNYGPKTHSELSKWAGL